jgi:hypothetical protein
LSCGADAMGGDAYPCLVLVWRFVHGRNLDWDGIGWHGDVVMLWKLLFREED